MSAPFATSKVISAAEPVVITVNTDPSNFATSEMGPRNRKWTLTIDLDAASMPENPYRAAIVVDNTAGSGTAWLVNGLTNPGYSQGHVSVPAGTSVTFSRPNALVGTGIMAVVLQGASSGTTVTELSYES